jgi:hypothetical protein
LGGALGALVYKALFTGTVNPLLWVFVALALGIILVAVFTENRSRPEGPGQTEKN